jgi:hypothetical protein
MILNYKKSESLKIPKTIDTTSSKTKVYLRKNIVKKERQDEEENLYQYYEYDETKLTKEEYEKYLNELAFSDIERQRADIDYIALMTGVEL